MKRGFVVFFILCTLGVVWYLWTGRYRPVDQLELPGQTALTTSLAELSMLSADEHPVFYKGFTISFNNETHLSNWVAYELTREEVSMRLAKRNDRFRKDTVAGLLTASKLDYAGSGYDRGHLAPAADMDWDQVAMDQSFFFSNIAPQTPNLNRGIWKKLEEQGRQWAAMLDGLYIVTGPLFDMTPDSIGILPVPAGFYKTFLVYQRDRQQAIAFLFPNKFKVAGHPLDYAISIDSLEQLIGIDLYDKLPDRIERKVERQISISDWPFD